MPDVNSIPFKQADGNGHYAGKQLPNDSGDFMLMLGLPAVAGDVSGPAGSTAGQVAIFDDATGKRLNTTSISGLARLTTGVLSSVPAPTGTVVGTTDTQTLTNKTLTNPVITGLTGLTKADVGLANVDNTSDATKNSAVATLTNKTIVSPTISNPSGLVKADVGLGNADNTSDANKPVSTAQQTALNLKADQASKGVANGYASLDASIKVPLAQIPDSVIGASQYQGTWNAATNTPAIPAAAIGNKGWYYSVAVAGTTNINGINVWAVGDQIISNGTVWQKIPNAQAVNSVNGQTGVVVLTKSDVGLGNADNTSDVNKPVSSATTTQLNLKEATANKGALSGYAGLDASGKVPVAQLPAAALSSGDVVGPASSVAGEIATYGGTTGKLLARLTPPVGAIVGTTDIQTLTNKTLTSPTLNSPVINTPTGITKADVGLGNVDNTSDATKNSATATLTGKTINGANNTLTVRLANDVTGNLPVTNLNAGTGANSGSFWRGDGQWAPPAGSGGDVQGPAASVDNELPLFSSTTGKMIKRCVLTGFVKSAASGAATAQTQMGAADIAPAAITGQTAKTTLDAADQFLIYDSVSTQLRKLAGSVARLPRGHLTGLRVTNGVDLVNDFTISAGQCRDSTDSVDMVLLTAITKQVDVAWAVGNNAGGRDTGTASDGGWHIWLIQRTDGTVVDVLLSKSASAPTMPANYTYKRRILSVLRVANTFYGINHAGDRVWYNPTLIDTSGAAGTGAAVNFATSVPAGIKLVGIYAGNITSATTASTLYAWDPDMTGAGPNIPVTRASAANVVTSAQFECMTNVSGQIRVQATNVSTWALDCWGYIDYRGIYD